MSAEREKEADKLMMKAHKEIRGTKVYISRFRQNLMQYIMLHAQVFGPQYLRCL